VPEEIERGHGELELKIMIYLIWKGKPDVAGWV
jgi:transcription initiation factor IIF auxiliary subunit